MIVSDFEKAVYELERVRLVVRVPSKTELGDYDFQRMAADNFSIAEWISSRVSPKINGAEVIIINGRGEVPKRSTKMSTLRSSYKS